MGHVITSATANLRPVKVERLQGHPPVIRYSTAMQPALVLRSAMPELSDDETIALAKALGLYDNQKETL